MSKNLKTAIGYYELTETRTFENHFECAAWRETIEVQPGKYPIELRDMKISTDERPEFHNEVESYISGAYISMDGIIVDDYFAGQYCGVPIRDYDTKQNAGKSGSHTAFTYLHEIAYSILTDANSPYHLNPEYEAREITFISSIDGKPCTTYGIFKK